MGYFTGEFQALHVIALVVSGAANLRGLCFLLLIHISFNIFEQYLVIYKYLLSDLPYVYVSHIIFV